MQMEEVFILRAFLEEIFRTVVDFAEKLVYYDGANGETDEEIFRKGHGLFQSPKEIG